jgi:cell pole-organizing protein PopZ
MQAREPSMEDILASIKKVIAEEKELRTAIPPSMAREAEEEPDEDILELDAPLAPPTDLGPPLLDEQAIGHSREALDQLTTIAATVTPVATVNPLEEMVRDMLKPILKQWLDDNLPPMVDELVKREISRITGRPV